MTTAVVKIDDLHKSYDDLMVLQGISFEVYKGETIVLIGASGSGKSTLLQCVNQLTPVTSGCIWVDGIEITDPKTDSDKIRQRMGMVFQSFNLFRHLTALGNVMLGPVHVRKMKKAEAEGLASKCLAQVGLQGRMHHYPTQLSGGEQQRVGIARALAMDPSVILFDEPTSSLDPDLTGEVLKVMQELSSAGMTMIVVTHEMGFAREAGDRMMFLADGKVVEEGEPAQMLRRPQDPRTRAFLSNFAALWGEEEE
ncbi:MAG: amino acid ABC transporter ATP-binding protein [Bacillota bacterium]